MAYMKIREDFSEVDKLLEGIDPSMVKVIGSYLYYPRYEDIDLVFYDPNLIWKLNRNANKNNYKIDMKLLSKDEFDNVEHLLSFRNFCMCYYCGKMVYSDKFINSEYLDCNIDCTKLHSPAAVIRDKARKYMTRGFKLKY